MIASRRILRKAATHAIQHTESSQSAARTEFACRPLGGLGDLLYLHKDRGRDDSARDIDHGEDFDRRAHSSRDPATTGHFTSARAKNLETVSVSGMPQQRGAIHADCMG